jgi:serine protease
VASKSRLFAAASVPCAAVALAVSVSLPVASAQTVQARGKTAVAARAMTITQMVVKLRYPTAKELVEPLGIDRVGVLASRAGVGLRAFRAMSGGASVLKLDRPMPLEEARVVAARIAADPAVEYAEPDLPVRAYQTAPPDASYATRHWHYFAPTTTFVMTTPVAKNVQAVGGLNAPPAWTLLKGSRKIVVAVIDTGVVTSHPELAAALLPGYDFVSTNAGGLAANFIANDGDGRDADANDPGDWITAAEKMTYPSFCDDGATGDSDSSWHGTHMTGTIIGVWGNGVGATPPAGTSTAGVAPNVKVVPVRGLGKCGGTSTDIADGIRWAAGLSVPGVPANPNPAHVINMSLGSLGGACGATYSTAVADATSAGALVVAASGNDGALGVSQPANCPGVLAVTAHTIEGDNADYSNVGAEVGISAPGGGAATVLTNLVNSNDNGYYTWSPVMFGATTPTSTDGSPQARTGPAIAGFTGTSSATAHASAVAALVKSVLRNATPAQVRTFITSTARAHPAGGYCLTAGVGTCGSGLIDAGAAVAAAAVTAPPMADAGADQTVTTGGLVTLSAAASVAFNGRTISTYAWTQTAGTAVTLNNANTATATFTAPSAAQTLRFNLTVTDNTAQTDTIGVNVTANPPPPPPPSGGGGGGALPWTQLLLLAVLALVGGRRRG